MKKRLLKLFICSLSLSAMIFSNVFAGQINMQEESAYISQVSSTYNLDERLVKAVIMTESSGRTDALSSSGCMGLMQISPRWHADRMARLGVNDLYDTHGNILVGCDYLSDLINSYGDIGFALMVYNQGYNSAKETFDTSGYSGYAQNVLSKMNEF